MPMDYKLYPKNWKEISFRVKENAGWRCQECDRPCRKPGESVADFVLRLYGDHPLDDEATEMFEHPQRWCLTTAHLNHEPSDCSSENLKALCAPCHCRYDNKPKNRAIRRRLKKERAGQLTLLIN